MNNTEAENKQTIANWLKDLSNRTTSNEKDCQLLQTLLKKLGFYNAVATCGVVYTEGQGMPMSIHVVAREVYNAICKLTS